MKETVDACFTYQADVRWTCSWRSFDGQTLILSVRWLWGGVVKIPTSLRRSEIGRHPDLFQIGIRGGVTSMEWQFNCNILLNVNKYFGSIGISMIVLCLELIWMLQLLNFFEVASNLRFFPWKLRATIYLSIKSCRFICQVTFTRFL